MIVVEPTGSSLIWRWIAASVSLSMDAVALSSTSILGFLNNALAIQTSCLCPTLRFEPPS